MSGYWRESDVSSADELDDAVITPEKLLVPWLRAKTVEQNAAAGPTAKPEEPSHECGYRRTRSEWLSGSWPLRQFDESLPTNKRKAEWHRFRDQFERIVSCKSPVDAITRLTGMKIFAGGYLLSIIEMQEKRLWNSEANGTADWYGTIIAALDKYFNEMCDTTKERMKFREMKMKADEAFADWVLRLESQSLFCEFTEEQRKEELVQALLRRSTPEIAGKLYELSDIFDNNVEKIISHGKHLDYIKKEADESGSGIAGHPHNAEAPKDLQESEWKPVNALHARKFASKQNRFTPYRTGSDRDGARSSRNRSDRFGNRSYNSASCGNCGNRHDPGQCRAFRVRCFKCNKVGHYAEFCRSSKRSSETKLSIDSGDFKREAGRINQVEIDDQ